MNDPPLQDGRAAPDTWRTVYIDGVSLWAPALPGWPQARAALRGERFDPPPVAARPMPTLLGANERRRAPDSVLMALEVAARAVADSRHPAAGLDSVFASAHGDLPMTDALCRTLAEDPRALSPTRFHHSVHNAPSGYWAMASGSSAASTALAAFEHSFACGLLEAATRCASDAKPVLLVGLDTEAPGPLASTNASRGLLALALVLAPRPSAASAWALNWTLEAGSCPCPAPESEAARALQANAMADGVPLFEALARGGASALALPVSAFTQLTLRLDALDPNRERPARA